MCMFIYMDKYIHMKYIDKSICIGIHRDMWIFRARGREREREQKCERDRYVYIYMYVNLNIYVYIL